MTHSMCISQVRKYELLCALQSCINNNYPSPLAMATTNSIKLLSGSSHEDLAKLVADRYMVPSVQTNAY